MCASGRSISWLVHVSTCVSLIKWKVSEAYQQSKNRHILTWFWWTDPEDSFKMRLTANPSDVKMR